MALTTQFAFEGFRIIRERPILIVWWGIVLFFGSILTTGLMMNMAGPEFNMVIQRQMPTDQAGITEMFASLGPAFLVSSLLSLSFNAVITCAIYRAVLRKGEPQYGYLKLGIDEVRQVAISLGLLIIVFFIMFGLMMVASLLGLIVGAVVPALVALVPIIALGFGMVLSVWLMVRLSLVSVQSFDDERINVSGSFRLTQSQFWSLALGLLVSLLLAFLVIMLIQVMYSAAAVAVTGADPEGPSSALIPDFSKIENLYTPLTLTYLVANGLSAPLSSAIVVGAIACAYKILKSDQAS
jgi:hypothetical protein